MSESQGAAPAEMDMDMETILTRAVKKLFKWQLSGITGTLIVASMLWLIVFFLFFLVLVFVMCVEYHYEKRERRDAELALPQDNGKMWAEKRPLSRPPSNSSLKKVAPIPMPPLPVMAPQPKAVFISEVPEVDEEPEAEALAVQAESPTEAVTEESVIVDAPADEPEEAPAETPLPDEESPAAEEENAPDNTPEDEDANEEDNNETPEDEAPPPESEESPPDEGDNDNVEAEPEEGEAEEGDGGGGGDDNAATEEEAAATDSDPPEPASSGNDDKIDDAKPPAVQSPSKVSKEGQD